METSTDSRLLSIVVPLFNEEAVLAEFHRRLTAVLDTIAGQHEIIYVDDGSDDRSLAILDHIRQTDSRVAVLELSRNFGKEIALTAGLDHACGDAVIVIDADLQDPPESIPIFLEQWRNGYDVVYGTRTAREGESLFKKFTAHQFYRIIKHVGRVKIPQDTGDFRLLSRRALNSLVQLREHHRFMKGLFAWIGYRQTAVPYRREPRFAGRTKWSYWRLWGHALEGFTSFTTTPLKVATYIGMIVALGAFVYALIIIYKTLMFGDPVRGYPSLMVVILFIGGVQMVALGVIGEYLGRMFNESKQRPLYFVKEFHRTQSNQQEKK